MTSYDQSYFQRGATVQIILVEVALVTCHHSISALNGANSYHNTPLLERRALCWHLQAFLF
jgi:hypothetical protein